MQVATALHRHLTFNPKSKVTIGSLSLCLNEHICNICSIYSFSSDNPEAMQRGTAKGVWGTGKGHKGWSITS